MNIQQILKRFFMFVLAAVVSLPAIIYALYVNNPNWAVAGLTFALVIITAQYAYSTYRLTELHEKERKSRIISELSRKELSKIKRKLIQVQNELNEGRYICDDADTGLKVCGGTRALEDLINECIANKRFISIGDETLSRYWPRIRKLLLDYKVNLTNLDNSIRTIASYFLQEEEFIGLIESLIRDYSDRKLLEHFGERKKEIVGRILHGLLLEKKRFTLHFR